MGKGKTKTSVSFLRRTIFLTLVIPLLAGLVILWLIVFRPSMFFLLSTRALMAKDVLFTPISLDGVTNGTIDAVGLDDEINIGGVPFIFAQKDNNAIIFSIDDANVEMIKTVEVNITSPIVIYLILGLTNTQEIIDDSSLPIAGRLEFVWSDGSVDSHWLIIGNNIRPWDKPLRESVALCPTGGQKSYVAWEATPGIQSFPYFVDVVQFTVSATNPDLFLKEIKLTNAPVGIPHSQPLLLAVTVGHK